MRKLVTLTTYVVILSFAGCEAIVPRPPDERMNRTRSAVMLADEHPDRCGGGCEICEPLLGIRPPTPVAKPNPYDATKRAFHYGDAVTITSGFHEGSRGIVFDVDQGGYRVCLDITDAMQWTTRRAGIDRPDIVVNVPESCLAPYERPEPDLAPVPVLPPEIDGRLGSRQRLGYPSTNE